jgi:outer membrane protein assembly factor BamB
MTLGLCLSFLSAHAADWPQWRGPNRDGSSPETNLMEKWASAPELKWIYRDAGKGYSGPAIVDGTYYSMGTDGDSETVFALDTTDGSRKWQTAVGSILGNAWGDGPRSTPTVSGDHLYAMSGTGNLVCLNTSDGREVWRVTMQSLGGEVPTWGYTESVLVDDGHVICTPGGSKGAVAALDARTGKLVWQSDDFTDEAQYSSIVAATIHNKKHYIQRTMKSIVGIDPQDGDILWKTDFPGRTAMIPTPIVKDNYVYVTGGYGTGCKLVEITENWDVKEVYYNRDMKNHHGGVVLVDDKAVFGYSDGVGWLMQDLMTGDEIWSERSKLGKGAVTMADGHFYCISEDRGEVELLKVTRDGYESEGRFTLDPQSSIRASRGKIWTHPVIVNGKLFLRDQDLVYCYDITD